MITDALWLALDRYGIVLGDLMLTASMIFGFLGFMRRNDLKRWLRRNSFGQVGHAAIEGERYDSLVLLISKPDVPCWLIDTLRPERVAVIATQQSRSAAEQVETHARERNITVTARMNLENADDAAECRAAGAQLLRHLKDNRAVRIAADTTGGTTPMSLGLFMAAEEAGATTLYVAAAYDRALGYPTLDGAHLVTLASPAK